MMDNNYHILELLHFVLNAKFLFLYASSAATYGGRTDNFIEDRKYERL